jgi:hypothetical protein
MMHKAKEYSAHKNAFSLSQGQVVPRNTDGVRKARYAISLIIMPATRLLVSEDLAFLLGAGAARLTGQVIAVDGGFTTVRPLVR